MGQHEVSGVSIVVDDEVANEAHFPCDEQSRMACASD